MNVITQHSCQPSFTSYVDGQWIGIGIGIGNCLGCASIKNAGTMRRNLFSPRVRPS